MTRKVVIVVAACGLALLAGAGGVTAAAGNEAPLANAGLDQEVPENATVQLDATGSVDPDGEITGYEWTIETPAGTTLDSSCRRCGRTQFRADRVGTYEVTVGVTDDDGASRTDTLKVEVEPVETPELSLSAPDTVTAGSAVNATATADAGDADLAGLDVALNGTELNSSSLAGDSATETIAVTLDEAGTRALNATVVDRLGRATTASADVTVEARDDDPSDGSTEAGSSEESDSNSDDSGSGESGGTSCSELRDRYGDDPPGSVENTYNCWDKVYGGGPDGELILLDADGDGEVNVDTGYDDGSEVTYDTDTDATDGTTTIDPDSHIDTQQEAFYSEDESANADLTEGESNY